jgi:hypothetical protein
VMFASPPWGASTPIDLALLRGGAFFLCQKRAADLTGARSRWVRSGQSRDGHLGARIRPSAQLGLPEPGKLEAAAPWQLCCYRRKAPHQHRNDDYDAHQDEQVHKSIFIRHCRTISLRAPSDNPREIAPVPPQWNHENEPIINDCGRGRMTVRYRFGHRIARGRISQCHFTERHFLSGGPPCYCSSPSPCTAHGTNFSPASHSCR